MSHMYAEDCHDPDDPDESCIELVHAGGREALKHSREWKAHEEQARQDRSVVTISSAAEHYLETTPYANFKTARECEHALEQFQRFAGDIPLSNITAVMVHDFAEAIGKNKSRKLIDKKIGYVRRMVDHSVRKGWVENNAFAGIWVWHSEFNWSRHPAPKGPGTSGTAATITLDILRCSVIFPDLLFSVNFTLECCFIFERRQLPQFTLAPDPLPRARRLSSSL